MAKKYAKHHLRKKLHFKMKNKKTQKLQKTHFLKFRHFFPLITDVFYSKKDYQKNLK